MTALLADRLRRALGGARTDGGRRTIDGGRPTIDDEEASSPVAHRPSSVVDRPSAVLPGVELTTDAGACLVYEQRYLLDHRHGGVTLGACLELPPLALACLARDGGLEGIDLRQAVFLDTETTGLAGGTGTSAFLVGIGYFLEGGGEGAFAVRQLFMRDFSEERALLLALREMLRPFRHVVTFNGKSFDLPLLETRYVLARQRRRWRPERHFDLLHPARRLWRERFESCSLSTLEEGILGHRRVADVPAWAIPGIYAGFVRDGEVGALPRVFEHNRHDLLSLVALLTHLGRRLAEPLAGELGPDELLAVARLYDEIGQREAACACLEIALERAEPPLRQRVQLQLALLCRRAGRRARALELWRELAVGSSALVGLIELAKHHEHQERDPRAALDVVEQALAILELREARDGAWRWRAEREDLERRLARLRRKRAVLDQPWQAGWRG